MSLLILTLILLQSRAQYVPPILITCPSLPQDTGGVWECTPTNTVGFPVLTGSLCSLRCNDTHSSNFFCDRLGRWSNNPRGEQCQKRNTTTSTTSTITSTLSTSSTPSTTSTP